MHMQDLSSVLISVILLPATTTPPVAVTIALEFDRT